MRAPRAAISSARRDGRLVHRGHIAQADRRGCGDRSLVLCRAFPSRSAHFAARAAGETVGSLRLKWPPTLRSRNECVRDESVTAYTPGMLGTGAAPRVSAWRERNPVKPSSFRCCSLNLLMVLAALLRWSRKANYSGKVFAVKLSANLWTSSPFGRNRASMNCPVPRRDGTRRRRGATLRGSARLRRASAQRPSRRTMRPGSQRGPARLPGAFRPSRRLPRA